MNLPQNYLVHRFLQIGKLSKEGVVTWMDISVSVCVIVMSHIYICDITLTHILTYLYVC